MYGKNNSGPSQEVWRVGDRVIFISAPLKGTVQDVPYSVDRRGDQTNHVWVVWDDGSANFEHPNNLDVALGWEMTPATKQSNYRLSPECRALLAAIARHYAEELSLPSFPMTAVIEMCVREKAKELGVTPKTAKNSR